MARLRNPKKDEVNEVFSLIDKVFQLQRGGANPVFVKSLLESFDMDDILIIEEDGRIVSHLYMKPYKVYICGTILEGAEVGGVATDERYRGRGFASTLLREAVRHMLEEGYDITTIGGYRDRYARWGWEHGGATRTYTITDRSVRYAQGNEGLELVRYDPPDPSMKKKIIQAYEKQVIHMIRTEVDQALTYDIPKPLGMQVWSVESVAGGFAYVVILRSQGRKRASVLEYGGDPNVLASGFRKIFNDWKLREIKIPSPGIYTEFTPILEQISGGTTYAYGAESWSTHPSRQINILNLEVCLEKLLPVAEKRVKGVLEGISKPYSLTLEIAETGQKATLLFDRGCVLTDGKGGEKFSLDRCPMVRLLFGQSRPSDTFNLYGKMASYLDLIFPLPFYEWETDKR